MLLVVVLTCYHHRHHHQSYCMYVCVCMCVSVSINTIFFFEFVCFVLCMYILLLQKISEKSIIYVLLGKATREREWQELEIEKNQTNVKSNKMIILWLKSRRLFLSFSLTLAKFRKLIHVCIFWKICSTLQQAVVYRHMQTQTLNNLADGVDPHLISMSIVNCINMNCLLRWHMEIEW